MCCEWFSFASCCGPESCHARTRPSHRFDITDLPDAEALLLEAARSAAASDSPAAAAALVLAAQGAAATARAVAALAAAVPAGVFAHRLCPQVGTEERFLLAACALAQRGARGEALAVLCRVLPPATGLSRDGGADRHCPRLPPGGAGLRLPLAAVAGRRGWLKRPVPPRCAAATRGATTPASRPGRGAAPAAWPIERVAWSDGRWTGRAPLARAGHRGPFFCLPASPATPAAGTDAAASLGPQPYRRPTAETGLPRLPALPAADRAAVEMHEALGGSSPPRPSCIAAALRASPRGSKPSSRQSQAMHA